MADKLSDAQLLAAISAAEESSLGVVGGAVSSDREDAIKRYFGKPYGNELPGRSQVRSRDVADVVEGVVANVVRPIVSGDQVIEFQPIGPDDEKRAKQETDYCNIIALQRNDGFVWLVTALKDAMLLRNGYVKVSWEKRSDIMFETYTNLSDEELAMLQSDGEVKIVQHTEYPDPIGQAAAAMQQPQQPAMAMMQGQAPSQQTPPQAPMLHDVKVKRVRPVEFARIDPVPPDEIIVSDRTRVPSVQDTDFVQHRPRKMISELRQAGYKVPDDIADDDQGETIEEIARQRFGSGDEWDDETPDPARRLVMFKETYIRIDRDGDGVAELRKVCHVGATILADEECEDIPIAVFAGTLISHQHLGMSVYDFVSDLAEIKTALLRSYLDNRNLQNNARIAVSSNVNLDDLLVSRPGGIIRVDGDPSANVFPIVTPDTSAGALQGLEYLDSVREQRSGYTRNTGGIDNDAISNSTASGMAMQLSQAQLRLEMTARTLAETGLKDVFKLIHAITLRHSSKSDKVQMNGEWVEVNPREWFKRQDLTISLGVGTGTPEQQLGRLMGLAPVLQQLGTMGLVGSEQAYNFGTELFKLAGYKSAQRFIKQPQRDQNGNVQEPPQQPPPEVQVAQMKQQTDQAKIQADQQGKQQELAAQAQLKQQELAMHAQVKQQEQANQNALQAQNDARDQAAQERKHQLDIERMNREFAFKEAESQRNDARERDKMLLQAQIEERKAHIAAQAHVQAAAMRPQPTENRPA